MRVQIDENLVTQARALLAEIEAIPSGPTFLNGPSFGEEQILLAETRLNPILAVMAWALEGYFHRAHIPANMGVIDDVGRLLDRGVVLPDVVWDGPRYGIGRVTYEGALCETLATTPDKAEAIRIARLFAASETDSAIALIRIEDRAVAKGAGDYLTRLSQSRAA